ncbi:MAG: CsgG/HfaB family protein [Chitinophagales bacterium]
MKRKLSFLPFKRTFKLERRIVMLQLFILTLYLNSYTQIFERFSNPQITVNIQHPPSLGLKINKIAFGQATGICADQIVDALVSDFVKNSVEVVDRENLNAILAEHKLTLSGYVDQTSAAAIGKILGPSVLIFVKVQQCSTQQDRLYNIETKYNSNTKTNQQVYAYIARTRTHMTVSIQSVDLATARIFAAQTLNYSPEKSNKSYDGYPEYPPEFDLKNAAIQLAVNDIHRMYLPWYEFTKLYFFDDKDFNLKQAFQALKGNNLEQAFDLSMQNLDACKKDEKAKDKILCHAYYNVGMCYMLRNQYDSALAYLNEAERARDENIVKEAIADCQKARSVQQSMRQVEARASFQEKQNQMKEERNQQEEAANLLTNDGVIEMVKLKLSDAIIIQKIKTAPQWKFDTTPKALASLTKAGVSEKVITAMIEKQ